MGSVAYEGTTYRQNPSTPTLRPTNGRPNVIGVDEFRRYFHGFAVKPKALRRGPDATSKGRCACKNAGNPCSMPLRPLVANMLATSKCWCLEGLRR